MTKLFQSETMIESTLELERVRTENDQLKLRLEEYQHREVAFKSLLPTTVRFFEYKIQ